jgi:16S rRNA processing protein RimM
VDDSEWLEIARLGRVRGLRGELFAQGEQTPEWYAALPEVRIRLAGGEWFGAGAETETQGVRIAEARLYSGKLAFRFSGIESATQAEPLVSGRVYVSRKARPAAPEGEIWLSELLGCAVEDAGDARLLGRVTGWQEYGGPFVTLEITAETGGEPILVPFVKSICVDVDVAGRKIRIDPPEGLLDLNAGPGGDPAAERE